MRRALTFLVVTLPRLYREWRWRRVQIELSDEWMRERKQRRALLGLTDD